tara:strand:+ start:656 stop:1144 length:489 start_codon:yes stop_codon:yes gene_type:complete
MNEGSQLKQVQRQTAYEQISAIFRSVYNLPKLQFVTVVLLAVIAIEGGLQVYQTSNNAGRINALWRDYWKASFYAESNNIDEMNKHLNKVFKNPMFNEDRKLRMIKKAENLRNNAIVDGILARQILLENPKAIEALDRMVKAQKHDPKAWDNFLKAQQKHEI